MASKKARWFMADDGGLPGTELGRVPHHATLPNIAILLDTLAMILEIYHVLPDLAKALFSMPQHWVTRSIYLHTGRAARGLLSTSPKLPAQAHHMS